MSTNQYYKKYASGGSFQNKKLDPGLTALQQRTQTQIKYLESQGRQITDQRNQHLEYLAKALDKEQDNREALYRFETEKQDVRRSALDQNHQTQINNLKLEAKEYENRSKMWAELSPTLSESFTKIATDVKGFIDTKNAIKEIKKHEADKTFGKMNTVHAKVIEKADVIGIANTQHAAYLEVARTGNPDAQVRLDYLSKVNQTRNPVLQEKLYQKIQEDFPGMETEFLSWLVYDAEIPVTKENVLSLYHFRAMEVMRQYGISPNSKVGFKLWRLFNSRGKTKEQQLTLQDRAYTIDKEVHDGGVNLVALSQPLSPADFEFNGYESAVKANDELANAEWIKIITNLNMKPIYTKNGFIEQDEPNTKDNIINWSVGLMVDYNDLDTFFEQIFGVNERNPDGFLIPGASRNSTKKTDRIFGKFPQTTKNEGLKAILAEEFSKQQKDVETQKAILNDGRLRERALPYLNKINSGYYKDNDEAFFNDWESQKGNKYSRDAFARLFGYKSDDINQDTLTSTIVQNYKAGNLAEVYTAWAARPNTEQVFNTYDPTSGQETKLNSLVRGLQDLAIAQGVPINKLDEKLKKYTSGLIDDIIERKDQAQTVHSSAQNMPDRALGYLLERFDENTGDAETRYAKAQEQLKEQLGISGVDVLKPTESGFRGSGQFRQKIGKSGTTNSVIFLAEAGQMFGDTSALEVDMVMEQTTDETRIADLTEFVRENIESDNPSISDQDIYKLVVHGTTSNPLLKHLMQDGHFTKSAGQTKTDFINSVQSLVDDKIVKQWGGENWCNHLSGKWSGIQTNDQRAIGVCARAIEYEFDTPAWKFLINPSLRDRLQR